MSATPTPSPVSLHPRGEVDVLLAPWLFGGLASSLLLGVLVVLSVIYFVRFGRHDPWLHRIAITLFLVVATLSWGTTLYLLNFAFVANFGSTEAMHAWPRVVVIPIFLPAVSALLSQLLFGTRVWLFSKKSMSVGFGLGVLIFLSLTAGIFALYVQPNTPKLGINGDDALFFEALGVPGVRAAFRKTVLAAEVFLWVSALTDCFISGCLAYQLARQKVSSVLDKSLDKLLSRILVFGVMTGGFTSAYSIGMAICVLFTTSENNIEIGLALQQVPIYGIVCCSSLLLRPVVARQAAGTSAAGRTRPRVVTDGLELEKAPSNFSQRWPSPNEKMDLVEKGLRVHVRTLTEIDGEDKLSPGSPLSFGSPICVPPPSVLSYHHNRSP